MTALYEQLQTAADAILARSGGRRPTIGLILGSGLGDYAAGLDRANAISYGDIPGFPTSTVVGHAGRLVVGERAGLAVMAMQGRVHYYEGLPLSRVTFPARALVLLGCHTLVITNAAGAVNPRYTPGELVIIRDHLNLLGDNPLRGENDERLGPRFPDMTQAYPEALRALARRAGETLGLDLREGVYACGSGPSYETPAEVKMLAALGADLAGMSTVPEVIVARHMGARVLGISCVTNLAAGITGKALSHDEVTETATRVKSTFTSLLDAILNELAKESTP